MLFLQRPRFPVHRVRETRKRLLPTFASCPGHHTARQTCTFALNLFHCRICRRLSRGGHIRIAIPPINPFLIPRSKKALLTLILIIIFLILFCFLVLSPRFLVLFVHGPAFAFTQITAPKIALIKKKIHITFWRHHCRLGTVL